MHLSEKCGFLHDFQHFSMTHYKRMYSLQICHYFFFTWWWFLQQKMKFLVSFKTGSSWRNTHRKNQRTTSFFDNLLSLTVFSWYCTGFLFRNWLRNLILLCFHSFFALAPHPDYEVGEVSHFPSLNIWFCRRTENENLSSFPPVFLRLISFLSLRLSP